jgi:peptidoglycan/xylan/chitin deacetylase (PgdA/CDA1 family)
MARPRHAAPRNAGRALRFAAGSAIVSVGLLLPTVTTTTGLNDLPPPITVFVGNDAAYIPPGTTFGAMVERFHLHAKDGDLVAVNGGILQPARFLGEILLNDGAAPSDEAALADGDRITVRDGSDHRESVFRTQIPVPPGTPADPQRSLATTPGTITVTKGSLSGVVVSWVFHATGPASTPNSVALTFDDGPWPGSTERVLAVLKKFKVSATFFVVGSLAQRYPSLVQDESQAGMTLGDHTFDHPQVPPFAQQTLSKATAEMALARDALAAAGVRCGLFRPPGGSYAPSTLDVARSLGMRTVLWSVDPADWTDGITPKMIVRRVLSHIRPGSIVLLHDGGGDQTATVKALPAIIKAIRKRHLSLVALTP